MRIEQPNFEVIDAGDGKFVKSWTRGGLLDERAKKQLIETAQMPFIYRWLCAMPDTHWGMGATVGSVLPTSGAIIPSAVGVDIGCGMIAVRSNLTYQAFMECLGDFPLSRLRHSLEKAVPAGRSHNGDRTRDVGSWGNVPTVVMNAWKSGLEDKFNLILDQNKGIKPQNDVNHLGTLGTGNHFIELERDENDYVWIMIHSGSRGIGSRFGSHFMRQAKDWCNRWFVKLPNPDLAYLVEGTQEFNNYLKAVNFCQRFAWISRELMLKAVAEEIHNLLPSSFELTDERVHCHHNYVVKEKHFGKDVWVTRKGAVRAGEGDYGLIPGSMGAKSFVVKGKGSKDSFESCSHGAGRLMGRNEAKKQISMEQHKRSLAGIECDADGSTLDESPAAYKPIELVMEAQKDLVEVVHTFSQFLCIKGGEDVKD
jgi:tRNA-splicing ligase RtcB